jgi:hypothetical protein
MDIAKTIAGDYVRFDNPNAGMKHDQQRCKRLLAIGENYQIDHIVVHDWSTDVYLWGFPKPFNSVMFDNIKVLEA